MKKVKRFLAVTIVGVLLMGSMMTVCAAGSVSHTCWDNVNRTLKHKRDYISSVSAAGMHPHSVNGTAVECHMERRTMEHVYYCYTCEEYITITEQKIWHSATNEYTN